MSQFNSFDFSKYNVAMIGNFLPRRCGIATFTADLTRALSKESSDSNFSIVAMNDLPGAYSYPDEVCFEVHDKNLLDYRMAANFLNTVQPNVVCLQHEFGIFGGDCGAHILSLLQELSVPVVTTFHSVLVEPNNGQKSVTQEICRISDRIVVMSQRATNVLEDVYNVPKDKVAFIPHGIPNIPFVDPNFYKSHFDLEGRTVILTFGLLSPGKGIEFMIDAMPAIVKKHPDVTYVVLGATHPLIKKNHDESYRDSLIRRAQNLGVENNVIFHGKFVELDVLCEYLGAADLYVTPYLNKDQIVSGTLAYAIGAGKAVVSTPYWYAEEMLDEGRGRIVPFKDSTSLANAILDLLDNDVEYHAMRKEAYTFSRAMIWKEVARSYLELFQQAEDHRQKHPKLLQKSSQNTTSSEIPQPNFDHLRRMTDGVGMLQHARCEVPDRNHGYCVDDNARALITTLLALNLIPEDTSLLDMAYRYMSFIYHAFNESNNHFRNFMSYDRQWLEEKGSQDSHARAVWSLGVAIGQKKHTIFGNKPVTIFKRAVATMTDFEFPRAWAFGIIGIHAYLQTFSGDLEAKRAMKHVAKKLFDLYCENSCNIWPWLEDTVTYDNGKIPQALLIAGRELKKPEMVTAGLNSLEWLTRIQTSVEGYFMPIGNRGWYSLNGEKARFDQQPLEAQSMLEACLYAYRITRDKKWRLEAKRCLEWFLGKNNMNVVMYDQTTGGCCDGLLATGKNLNQGAESTLAWLQSLLEMYVEYGSQTTTPEAVKSLSSTT